MKNLDRIDHEDQEIKVEIEIEEIVEEVVMIGMIGKVEVLVDHQIEVLMIEEIIEIGIEMIQEIDIKGMMIDRYSRERSRSPGDYNSTGYRGRSNSGSRYQGGGRQPPKKCFLLW